MYKKFLLFMAFMLSCLLYAQCDTIQLKMRFSENLDSVYISQRTVFYNNQNTPLKKIGFHAWINAYSHEHTALSKRKLEDRNKNLYFSTEDERGQINELKIPMKYELKQDEFLTLTLEQEIAPGEFAEFNFDYAIKIPKNEFTKYGIDEKSVLLKYFNLQPVKFYENGNPQFTHYVDLETLPVRPSFYKIEVENFYEKLEANLIKKDAHLFEGYIMEVPTLTVNPEHLYTYSIDGTEIAVNYKLSEKQIPVMQEVLERQVSFLKENYALVTRKILITFKTKKLQNFTGVEDIKLVSKYKIKFFTQEEQIDMKMFQMLTYEALREHLNIDLETNHWILHGLLVYMQINYIKQYYPELKLAGHLPEEFKVLGLKPLKWFFAADLNLTDRYKLAYLYIVKQNYEQDISTPFSDFNKINQTIISAFKTGIGFNYINEYMGNNSLNLILKEFLNQHHNKYFSGEEFEEFITSRSPKDIDWFFEDFINSSDKLNFKLKGFKENKDSLWVTIYNKTDFKGPFRLVAYDNDSIVRSEWIETKGKKATYHFPNGDYDKLIINPGYTLAEFNFRDNYLYTKGFFKNSKKLKPKLYADVDNPEYEPIYIVPELRFNNYDKVLIGAEFSNYAIMEKQFKYTLSPSYSTGTNSLTGSASLNWNILPEKGIFRLVSLFSKASYYHYDVDVSYQNFLNYVKFNFKKDPRKAINSFLVVAFQNIDKEPNLLDPDQNPESLHYNILQTSYVFRDDSMIHEKYFQTTYQIASLFAKISGEYFWRYEYAKNQKLTFRLYGAYYFKNRAVTDYFNTSLDRISDYAFGYGLLARSDTSGILSQQYVMAEGGFVSNFNDTANQWITSLRTEFPIWKMFMAYGGVGLYKNKALPSKFIYESGIKFRMIPDFFELYFPVQSTLGFEPSEPEYFKKIRFTFNLNFDALRRYFERGWY